MQMRGIVSFCNFYIQMTHQIIIQRYCNKLSCLNDYVYDHHFYKLISLSIPLYFKMMSCVSKINHMMLISALEYIMDGKIKIFYNLFSYFLF